MSPPRNMAMPSAHPSPLKTYTPLSALSNMQPPGSPHHMHHVHHHPKTVTISATQEISSLERHGCPSAFSAPTVYGPAPPPPTLATVAARPPYPLISKTPPDPAFVAGKFAEAIFINYAQKLFIFLGVRTDARLHLVRVQKGKFLPHIPSFSRKKKGRKEGKK